MSEIGYTLAGIGIGLVCGFYVACYIMATLIKDRPDTFASFFKKK